MTLMNLVCEALKRMEPGSDGQLSRVRRNLTSWIMSKEGAGNEWRVKRSAKHLNRRV